MKPRDPVQTGAKYLSATIEINRNSCGCSNKMVNYCNFFNNYINAFFVVEREVIVANLRKNKTLSLCKLAVIVVFSIPWWPCTMKNIKFKTLD